MLWGVLYDTRASLMWPCYYGEGEKAWEECRNIIRDKAPGIVKFMKGKFAVGDEPTAVDFVLVELVELLAFLTAGELFNDHPTLVQYHKNVTGLPGLKEYLASPDCRENSYTFSNNLAVINNRVPGEVKKIVEAAYAKHLPDTFQWPPLESNPEVFTNYMHSIGVS